MRQRCRRVVNDNSPSFLRKEVEKSLKRLRTDYIRLLYIRYPNQDTPKDEAAGTLKRLKEEGKIQAIGISIHFLWRKSMRCDPAEVIAAGTGCGFSGHVGRS